MSSNEVPKKPKKQVRVMKSDLKDLIRDEIYGMATQNVICIKMSDVKKLAARIAKRATIGH